MAFLADQTVAESMMASTDENVVPIGTAPSTNGGDRLVEHRLKELEKRMHAMEADVKSTNSLYIEMNTKLDGKASESLLYKIFAVTLGLVVALFVGHVILAAT